MSNNVYQLIAVRLRMRIKAEKSGGHLEAPAKQLAETLHQTLVNITQINQREKDIECYFREIQKFFSRIHDIIIEAAKDINRKAEKDFAEFIFTILYELLIVASGINDVIEGDTVLVFYEDQVYKGEVIAVTDEEKEETVHLYIEEIGRDVIVRYENIHLLPTPF